MATTITTAQIERFAAAVAAASEWTGLEWDLEPVSTARLEGWLEAEHLSDRASQVLGREAQGDETCREAGERILASHRETEAAVEASADSAREQGALALECLREGDIERARHHIDRACTFERQWGDCPSWGLAADALAEIEDEIEVSISEQATREATTILAHPAHPVLCDRLSGCDREADIPLGLEPGDVPEINISLGEETPTAGLARLGGDADPVVRSLAQEILASL